MEKQNFYANGKLLITGEYLVLEGALALAVPTVLGQAMSVGAEETGVVSKGDREKGNRIYWKSYYKDECWFEGEFSIPELNVIRASDDVKAAFISNLLAEADKMNPDHLSGGYSFEIETRLGFDPEWGLGSSSSLINLVADWFRIDPWELYKKTQSGSGYDITCARVLNPIWFRLSAGVPLSQKVDFNPEFKDSLAFVYSGRKQDSALSVDKYLGTGGSYEDSKDRISAISHELPTVKTLERFNTLIDRHEEIISEILQVPTVKTHYPDFPGSLKSLGAWGGDFILASSDIGFNEIKSYFSSKGLDVIFTFDELILGIGQ